MEEATVVQVTDAYGAPRDRYEDQESITLTYEYGVYRKAVLTFDAETEILNTAELCNQTNPEDAELYKTVKKGATQEVKDYQAPLMVSGNIMDFTVEYGAVFISFRRRYRHLPTMAGRSMKKDRMKWLKAVNTDM